MQKKKLRNFEKVYAQVLQLGSAAEHLKDLVALAKLDQYKCNVDQIVDYIESNLENTVYTLVKALNTSAQKADAELVAAVSGKLALARSSVADSESTGTYEPSLRNVKFESEKLNVRSNNFKKFRQSTQDLIK